MEKDYIILQEFKQKREEEFTIIEEQSQIIMLCLVDIAGE